MSGKDHASSMTEIIDYWMRSCGGRPTWRELADAFKRIKEDSLAQQLMGIYDTGGWVVVTMTASVSQFVVCLLRDTSVLSMVVDMLLISLSILIYHLLVLFVLQYCYDCLTDSHDSYTVKNLNKWPSIPQYCVPIISLNQSLWAYRIGNG